MPLDRDQSCSSLTETNICLKTNLINYLHVGQGYVIMQIETLPNMRERYGIRRDGGNLQARGVNVTSTAPLQKLLHLCGSTTRGKSKGDVRYHGTKGQSDVSRGTNLPTARTQGRIFELNTAMTVGEFGRQILRSRRLVQSHYAHCTVPSKASQEHGWVGRVCIAMREQIYSIYLLIDPRDNAVRYVGTSRNPRQRWYQHNQCTDGSPEKIAWIKELKHLHLKPVLTIIETIHGDLRQAWPREKYWIEFYIAQGASLTNLPNTFEKFFEGYGTDEWNLKYRGSTQS